MGWQTCWIRAGIIHCNFHSVRFGKAATQKDFPVNSPAHQTDVKSSNSVILLLSTHNGWIGGDWQMDLLDELEQPLFNMLSIHRSSAPHGSPSFWLCIWNKIHYPPGGSLSHVKLGVEVKMKKGSPSVARSSIQTIPMVPLSCIQDAMDTLLLTWYSKGSFSYVYQSAKVNIRTWHEIGRFWKRPVLDTCAGVMLAHEQT